MSDLIPYAGTYLVKNARMDDPLNLEMARIIVETNEACARAERRDDLMRSAMEALFVMVFLAFVFFAR